MDQGHTKETERDKVRDRGGRKIITIKKREDQQKEVRKRRKKKKKRKNDQMKIMRRSRGGIR